MNQKTQQCVQSDAELCICRVFTEKLYFSTLDLWKHHNDLLLKWPQIIIGGTIAFILNLAHNDEVTNFLFKPQSWGDNNSSPQIVTGLLLILGGLAIITMLYVMWRARSVMAKVEAELSKLSSTLFANKDYFKNMNHPDGMSGRTLIWLFMAFVLAFPMTILGFCLLFGLDKVLRYWILFPTVFLILFFHGLVISLYKKHFKDC